MSIKGGVVRDPVLSGLPSPRTMTDLQITSALGVWRRDPCLYERGEPVSHFVLELACRRCIELVSELRKRGRDVVEIPLSVVYGLSLVSDLLPDQRSTARSVWTDTFNAIPPSDHRRAELRELARQRLEELARFDGML